MAAAPTRPVLTIAILGGFERIDTEKTDGNAIDLETVAIDDIGQPDNLGVARLVHSTRRRARRGLGQATVEKDCGQ